MTTERPACPDCDSLDLSRTVRKRHWYCKQCTWKGMTPTYRARQHSGNGRVGLAGVLERMDPDDVGGGG